MIRTQEEMHRMSDTPKNCIIFFVKDPVKGAVKRRLAADLNETIAVELYRIFILDMLATLDTCEAQCLICVYPESALEKVKKWLGPLYHYLPQEGKDLGERMKDCFIEAFSMKCKNVILIGSDIPDLPLVIIKAAFRMFETHDAVVGPAHDGGYYLIGFRNDTFVPEVFDKMKWGGETVLRSTLNRLKKRGCRVHLLPAWSDVDTLADVMALLQRNTAAVGACPKTISYLKTASIDAKSSG